MKVTATLTDEEYEIADRITEVLNADPSKSWTPSTMGRKVHADTYQVRDILNWLVASYYADSDDRGAWTRYFALTGTRRSAKLYG